jgi:hypothetical protein
LAEDEQLSPTSETLSFGRITILILAEDELLSPTFEEIILINVLYLVNERLLDCVRYHYQHLSGKLRWLMDLKNDIFVMRPKGENNR